MLRTRLTLLLVLLLCSCAPILSPSERAARDREAERMLAKAVASLREESASSLDAAQASLLLAYELSPQNARILDGLGALAWRRARFDDAERFFEEAVRIEPGYGRGWGHLALAAERRGSLHEAKELYEKALQLMPLDARTRNNYAAFLYDFAGDRRRAAIELQKALSSAPPDTVRSRNAAVMGVSVGPVPKLPAGAP